MWTESGPGGGIRLLDGWQSKLGGMTGEETSALMLLGVPSIADDLGLRDVTAAAQSKLLGALPVPLRAGAQLWRDRLYVDAPGWFDGPRDNGDIPRERGGEVEPGGTPFAVPRFRRIDPAEAVLLHRDVPQVEARRDRERDRAESRRRRQDDERRNREHRNP